MRVRRGLNSPAGVRDAAAASLCFFGVRRFAEMQALKAEDLAIGNGHAVALIRKQKKDPLGAGMRCVIPQFPL